MDPDLDLKTSSDDEGEAEWQSGVDTNISNNDVDDDNEITDNDAAESMLDTTISTQPPPQSSLSSLSSSTTITRRIRVVDSRLCQLKLSGSTITRALSKKVLGYHRAIVSDIALSLIRARIRDSEQRRSSLIESRLSPVSSQPHSSPTDSVSDAVRSQLVHDEFEEEAMLEAEEDEDAAAMADDDEPPAGDNELLDGETMIDDNDIGDKGVDSSGDESDIGDIGELPSQRLTMRQRAMQGSEVAVHETLMSLPSLQPKNHKTDQQRAKEKVKQQARKLQQEQEKQQVIEKLLSREVKSAAGSNSKRVDENEPKTLIRTVCRLSATERDGVNGSEGVGGDGAGILSARVLKLSVNFPATFQLPAWMTAATTDNRSSPSAPSVARCSNPLCSERKRYTDSATMLPVCSLGCIRQLQSQQLSSPMVS